MSETGNFDANFLPSRMLATTKSERAKPIWIERRQTLKDLPKLHQRSP
jgi:hypothetical protein